MKRFVWLSLLFLLPMSVVFPLDFGLFIDQKGQAENQIETEGAAVSWNPVLAPWFSWDGGQGLSLYFSAALSFKYNYYDDAIDDNDRWEKPLPLPELSRFALSYRPNQDLFVEAGRITYTDAMDFAASGLFDGFRIDWNFSLGDLSAGIWYTGFLYKESAKILMTATDAIDYAEPCDWDNFGAYFASRRALAALRWDIPLGEFHALSLEALAQFDLNGNGETLHSQYGEVLVELLPTSKLGITFGGLFEAMEGEGDFGAALGALARIRADVPGSLNDSFTAGLKFTSGPWNDTFTAFIPLSSSAMGSVFTGILRRAAEQRRFRSSGTLSGLALASAGYAARLHDTLLLDSALRYFIRAFDEDGESAGNYLSGGELWAALSWQPLDDLRLSLGGGVFLPGLGNIYPAGIDPAWKVSAGISLSL
jgi:hypothetical protein